jgi:CheY-like chemotaxis protein
MVVSDNGCGIKKENIKNIFDPFFTTKTDFDGTGLGLAVSYGIIKEHKGQVNVVSSENKGTNFTIDFPVKYKKRIYKNQKTILIIDDEVDFLESIKIYLELYKLNIITLHKTDKLKKILRENANIDIIITDLHMPNYDVFSVLNYINKNFPWIKVICCSGVVIDQQITNKLLEYGAVAFYEKPVDLNQLTFKIKTLRN